MDKFGDIPAQARDLAGRVAEHGREVGDKLQEVPGNVKGAIDKSTSGKSCVVLVADNFLLSGNGGIAKTDIGQCSQAGLTMPTAMIPGGAKLVL